MWGGHHLRFPPQWSIRFGELHLVGTADARDYVRMVMHLQPGSHQRNVVPLSLFGCARADTRTLESLIAFTGGEKILDRAIHGWGFWCQLAAE